jgi:hypothetical protein
MVKKLSNITSANKLIVLSIFTFGIYELVWMYRNWMYFKQQEKSDILPFMRSWFAIFFIFSLFKKIKVYAKKVGYKKDYSSGGGATAWILLGLMGSLGHPIFYFVSFLSFLAILAPLDAMNFYYKKKERNCVKRNWEWWHIVLLVISTFLWVLIFIGMFLPA